MEKSEVSKKEEAILKFWQENKIFERSLEKPAPNGEFVFYDGPPFATGLPHYGHILASAIKDAVPRYQTMRGRRVERRWGWDCHGLPIENLVEKELAISGKKEIEAIGVAKFNETARSKVLTYVGEWKKTVERIGRWVDFDGSYKTLDNAYMESVWWALSEMNKKGLLYEGRRVLPYCPRCETPIANAEIAMDGSYKDISDLAVFVKFKLTDSAAKTFFQVLGHSVFLLAWTTTAWTLPGNAALAVGGEILYVGVKMLGTEEILILAKDRLVIFKDLKYEIIAEFKGQDLVGLTYKPLFDYYLKEGQVYSADFVTTEEGTGIVHIAPGFGEDDFQLAQAKNLPVVIHVDGTGRFKPEVKDFAGLAVKPKNDNEKTRLAADLAVIKYLQEHNLFFAKEKIVHAYPHCHRCETPLYYYAIPAWFLKIQDLKPRLAELNQEINWIPEHLKFGRFQKSMDGAPDWNISRNRYWATPLPIWKCGQCAEAKVIGSVAELVAMRTPRNRYFVMRHGEAESNVRGLVSNSLDGKYHLTERGKGEVMTAAKKFAAEKIDLIIASDILRARETAELVAAELKLPKEAVVFDPRLREIDFGDLENKPIVEYHAYLGNSADWFTKQVPDGEALADVRLRAANFLYKIDQDHEGKNILFVTHDMIARLLFATTKVLNSAADGFKHDDQDFFRTGEVRPLKFVPLPHNGNFELDLHRPHIDEVKLKCGSCGGEMRRIPEVVDCWFESGSMPFAAEHYPFENKEKTERRLPADFVAEYLPQTRTWFYYTHVIATILFDRIPFRQVVTTGSVLAADGQKMSKSKNNFPDPWLVFDKYGVDALRFYLLSSPLLKAEDLNFSESGLAEVSRRVIIRLRNVLAFYELYADKNEPAQAPEVSSPVLDRWFAARLAEASQTIAQAMDAFLIDQALKPLDLLVDDFSTWYLRRSRDRFKAEGAASPARGGASGALRWFLREAAKLLAPFTPFVAEEIFQAARGDGDPESVHLENWPADGPVDRPTVEEMRRVREIVSAGLEARSKAGIKVRQPLGSCQLSAASGQLTEEYQELIRSELNVEKIVVGQTQTEQITLDLAITPELKEKGEVRELIRAIQDWRKKQNLKPGELAAVPVPRAKQALAKKHASTIKSATAASDFQFSG